MLSLERKALHRCGTVQNMVWAREAGRKTKHACGFQEFKATTFAEAVRQELSIHLYTNILGIYLRWTSIWRCMSASLQTRVIFILAGVFARGRLPN